MQDALKCRGPQCTCPQELFKKLCAHLGSPFEATCTCTCRHSGPQGSIEPFTIVDDPSAWLADDYRGKEESFIYHFTPEDLAEVEAAVAQVEAKGLRIEVRALQLRHAIFLLTAPLREGLPMDDTGSV